MGGLVLWYRVYGCSERRDCCGVWPCPGKCFGVASSPGEREGCMDASLSGRLLSFGLASTKGKCNTN